MPDNAKYERGQVVEIIHAVVDTIGKGAGSQREVFAHISELAEIIDSLKRNISQMNPEHVGNSHIPDATDELDAVVLATAEATNTIMGLCEDIQALGDTLDPETRRALNDKTTRIFEACSFQDITGQRIRNVVATLRVIEEKVDKIMELLSTAMGLKTAGGHYEKIISADDEKSLLNGPQMPDKAITQADIDKLLAEFDGK